MQVIRVNPKCNHGSPCKREAAGGVTTEGKEVRGPVIRGRGPEPRNAGGRRGQL